MSYFFSPLSFPPKFPRMLDFVPSLNIHSLLDRELSICAIESGFSTPLRGLLAKGMVKEDAFIGPSGSPRQPGMFAWPIRRRNSHGRKRLMYTWADRSPKDLLKFVRDESGTVYDVAIKRLAIRCKLPKSLEESELFSGVDSLMFFLSGRGNHPRRYSRMLGLRFWNPYRYIKNTLIEGELLKRNDKSLRMIRSTLMADNFVTDDGRGWRQFTSEVDGKHRFPKSVVTAQRSVVQEKWWRDMAYLSKTTAFIDSQTTQPLCIYDLLKKHKRVCYPLTS